VGHQGFINQFIDLIVPTHFKCGIGLEGTVELFGLIPSSKPICCSFIVQNEGTLVVANSTRSCDSIDFQQAMKYQI
jgi:hypothetical protein